MTTSNKYNYQRADYPLLQGIRLRRGVLAWSCGLLAWALLLGSTLINEDEDLRFHWARTALITSGFAVAALGRFAVEDSVKVGRVILDYEDVTDAGRQQILWHETTDVVEEGQELAPVETIDAWEYIGKAAKEWRTHLALLSPTDTGKSSFLYLLLGACSRARETCLQVVEGKGAEWAGVPDRNIIRINFRPSLEDAHDICFRLHKTLDLIQQRVNQGRWQGPQLMFVLEEYLALSSTLKKQGEVYKDYARSLEVSVEAMAAVARGGGGQLILLSQSPNADDLKFSGGVRSNFRIACLGSRLGGFDAVERMIDNYNFVNKRSRETIEAQYQSAKKQLFTERHPLILTNLLGEWVCFPLPYLEEKTISALSIDSQEVPADLLFDDGWIPGEDIVLSTSTTMPATIQRPTKEAENDGLPASLNSVEELIKSILAKAEEPLKAHEIRSKSRPLRKIEKERFTSVLSGLVRKGAVQVTEHGTDEETPRYSLPPDSFPTER